MHTSSTGDVFDCNWENGLKEGTGRERYADGGVFEGTFHNGKRDGDGMFVYASGSVFRGVYQNDLKLRGQWLEPCAARPRSHGLRLHDDHMTVT